MTPPDADLGPIAPQWSASGPATQIQAVRPGESPTGRATGRRPGPAVGRARQPADPAHDQRPRGHGPRRRHRRGSPAAAADGGVGRPGLGGRAALRRRRVPRRDRRQLRQGRRAGHHPRPRPPRAAVRPGRPGRHRHPEPGAPGEGLPHGLARRPHRPAQPPAVRGPGGAGARPVTAGRRAGLHVLRRPRQLQDGQRHLRPRHRRPAHPAGGPAPGGHGPQPGHGGPGGRRRVRHPAARPGRPARRSTSWPSAPSTPCTPRSRSSARR